MYLVTAQQMQEIDRTAIKTFGLPGSVLMENAGRSAADILIETFPDIRKQHVGVAAGRGNNGGDGFVIARCLSCAGIAVTVFLLAKSSQVKGDAAANLDLLYPLNVRVVEILDNAAFVQEQPDMRCCDVWVDALLGTGLNADVTGLYKDVIDFINAQSCPVLAVDIPSGLNADTGSPCGVCIRAHTTVTFGCAKIGHMMFPGAEFSGRLKIVDIGIPPHIVLGTAPSHRLLTSKFIASVLPSRSLDSHKGSHGHALLLVGSTGKAGAAVLAGLGALRSGAGLVTLGIPGGINAIIQSRLPEAMTLPLGDPHETFLDAMMARAFTVSLQGKKCLATGPGIGMFPGTRELILQILRDITIPIVIDADALNAVCDNLDVLKCLKVPAILTPHPGEMSRLTGANVSDIQADRIGYARRFARTYRVHVVLKGAHTVIAHPDGMVDINPTGNPGMAAGGMGDILTGIIAGLLAQGLSPEAAASAGVYIHGKAADMISRDRGPFGFLASEVADMLPRVFRDILSATISGE